MNYKLIINPVTGKLQKVLDSDSINTISFKESVADEASLPTVGNTKNDGRFTDDTGHLYIWNGTVWVDQGDIIDVNWGTIGGTLSNQSDLQTELDTLAESGINVVIGDGVNEISTGLAIGVEAPFDMTLESASIFAIDGNSGSVKVDIWKDTYANFPPTDADTITGGEEPEISSGTKSQDTSLTSWTKTITKGDIIYFNVDSVTTLTKVLVSLKTSKV